MLQHVGLEGGENKQVLGKGTQWLGHKSNK